MAFEVRDITAPNHHHRPHHHPHDTNRVRSPSLQGRYDNIGIICRALYIWHYMYRYPLYSVLYIWDPR